MERFEEVYQVVRLIPPGKVSSYGAIARYLGTSPRIVGWAMNSVKGSEGVPAHRVVNRHGVLTGKMHFESPHKMQEQLENEGLEIAEDQILNFREHLWDPSEELL